MNFKLKVFLPLVLFIGVMLVGCGSIIHGSKQVISFQSTPAVATVEVLDAMNVSYGSCETPCSLELKRKREYKVIMSKQGYNAAELIITKKTDGWIWGNILFGGVIGIIIDFSNGAAYKLSPEMLNTTLTESTTSNVPEINSPDGLVLIDFDDLTPVEQERIKKLTPIKL